MTKTELRNTVDALGSLKARIADLTREETRLKQQLIDADVASIDGDLFRATVSTYEQDRLDMDAVRAKLSPQFIKAHTTTTTITKVMVKAQVRDSIAA